MKITVDKIINRLLKFGSCYGSSFPWLWCIWLSGTLTCTCISHKPATKIQTTAQMTWDDIIVNMCSYIFSFDAASPSLKVGGRKSATTLVFYVVSKRTGIIRVRLPVTSADWSEHSIACAGNSQACPRLKLIRIGTSSFHQSTGVLSNVWEEWKLDD